MTLKEIAHAHDRETETLSTTECKCVSVKLRRTAITVVDSIPMRIFIMLLILSDISLMILPVLDIGIQQKNIWLIVAEIAIVTLFTLEVLARLVGLGRHYFVKDCFNIIDFTFYICHFFLI